MAGDVTGPLARTDGLICEEVDGELVVYDQRCDRMTRLNRSAAVVWRACDGHRSREELLVRAHAELGDVADDDLVAVALDVLAGSDLLEGEVPARAPRAARESRRRFIRRVGTIGAAAAALPIVHAVAAPAPAAAQSGGTCGTCSVCFCPPCTCPCDSCTLCICVSCT